MAEAVLEFVLGNLSSLVQKKVGLFLGFDEDFKSLSSLLTSIKATLEDAEEKQFSNKAIKDWLQKLKDAAHVLGDILDECNTQALELEYEGFKWGKSVKVRSSFLSSLHPKHVAFRYKIAKKMKRIRERLVEIAAERSMFHLTEIVREGRSRVIDWRETTSIITQPQVYGRDEDKNKIVDFLVSEASEMEDLSVYPLIGIRGLGKTTLAQHIFNHERIINHFELRIWVYVSKDFSLKRMTKAIIGSASGNANGCADLDLEPLQRRLQDLLQRKRYLLVLDDVWDEDQENWQWLKSVLACGGKGASILVTTRLPKVAEIMGTVPSHKLSVLSDKNCWELFKQRAFGPNEAEQAELVVIGKEILKKCGGVPLAAIALGSLLRFKREEKEWLYVKESKLWNTEEAGVALQTMVIPTLNSENSKRVLVLSQENIAEMQKNEEVGSRPVRKKKRKMSEDVVEPTRRGMRSTGIHIASEPSQHVHPVRPAFMPYLLTKEHEEKKVELAEMIAQSQVKSRRFYETHKAQGLHQRETFSPPVTAPSSTATAVASSTTATATTTTAAPATTKLKRITKLGDLPASKKPKVLDQIVDLHESIYNTGTAATGATVTQPSQTSQPLPSNPIPPFQASNPIPLPQPSKSVPSPKPSKPVPSKKPSPPKLPIPQLPSDSFDSSDSSSSDDEEDVVPLRQRQRPLPKVSIPYIEPLSVIHSTTTIFEPTPPPQTTHILPPQPQTTKTPSPQPKPTTPPPSPKSPPRPHSPPLVQPDLNLPSQPEHITEPIIEEPLIQEPGSDTICEAQPLTILKPVSDPSFQLAILVPSPPQIPSPPHSPILPEHESTIEPIVDDDLVITATIAAEVVQELELSDDDDDVTVIDPPILLLLAPPIPAIQIGCEPPPNHREARVVPEPHPWLFTRFELFKAKRHFEYDIWKGIEEDRMDGVSTAQGQEDFLENWQFVHYWFEKHKKEQLERNRRLLTAFSWNVPQRNITPVVWEPELAPILLPAPPAPVPPPAPEPVTPPPASTAIVIRPSSSGSASASTSHSVVVPKEVLDKLVEDNKKFTKFMEATGKHFEESDRRHDVVTDMLQAILDQIKKP